MVLDENALEAMLARQREAERGYEPTHTVRTEQNDEFEVYERPDAPSKTGTGLNVPQPALRTDSGRPDDFEELPPRQAPAAYAPPEAFAGERPPAPMPNQPPDRMAPSPQHPPAPPQPQQTNAAPQAPYEAPRAAPREPVPQATVPHESPVAQPAVVEAPRKRPQIWPPIGLSQRDASGAPGPQAEAPADVATPGQPMAPPPPEPVAAAPGPDPFTHGEAPVPDPLAVRSHARTPHAFPATGVDGNGCNIAIVQAQFNQELTDVMAEGAVAHARAAGAQVTHHVTVPGVFDLPLAVQQLARRKDVDGVVVIGAVVSGETKHDELITFSTAKTLQEISLATEVPIGLGIIGPGMTWEQAMARVGNGVHAVEAVLAQWQALRSA
jgi:6,7-dimethyl-8-ribityllumazine synthase